MVEGGASSSHAAGKIAYFQHHPTTLAPESLSAEEYASIGFRDSVSSVASSALVWQNSATKEPRPTL